MLDIKAILKLGRDFDAVHQRIVNWGQPHIVVVVKGLLEIDLIVVLVEHAHIKPE